MGRTTREPLAQVRRYVWLTTVSAAVAVALLVVLVLAGTGTRAGWLVLAPATAVVATLYVWLTMSAMPGIGVTRLGRWAEVLVIAVGVGAWWFAGMSAPWSVLPALAVGGAAAVRQGRARWALVWGAALALAAIDALGLRTPGPWTDTPRHDSAPFFVLVVTVVLAGSNLLQVWLWAVVLEIDRARRLAAELAVTRERLRFAADLHDVQGHHLQAIALKSELAERLVGHDDDAARANAAEAGELARTALRETREVVRGYRRSDLPTEIGNAVQVLRAAGIDAAVDGDPATVPPPLQTLFGALVREGTTNVLRHSAALACTLSVRVDGARTRVTLTNDGVAADRGTGADGTGLAGLRERFATLGGALLVHHDGDRFQLVGEAVAP